MSANKQTQIPTAQCLYTVTCIAPWRQMQKDPCSWTVGDVCMCVSTASAAVITKCSVSYHVHFYTTINGGVESGWDTFFKWGKVSLFASLASNQRQLRNQHLDFEPLSGWERTGRSTGSLKRNSCKLQIGKPLWEAAVPFLLSSKCWHADSFHSFCVIRKMGERHKAMILHKRPCIVGNTPEPGSRCVFK